MPPNLVLIVGVGAVGWSLVSGNTILLVVGVVLALLGYWIHIHE